MVARVKGRHKHDTTARLCSTFGAVIIDVDHHDPLLFTTSALLHAFYISGSLSPASLLHLSRNACRICHQNQTSTIRRGILRSPDPSPGHHYHHHLRHTQPLPSGTSLENETDMSILHPGHHRGHGQRRLWTLTFQHDLRTLTVQHGQPHPLSMRTRRVTTADATMKGTETASMRDVWMTSGSRVEATT